VYITLKLYITCCNSIYPVIGSLFGSIRSHYSYRYIYRHLSVFLCCEVWHRSTGSYCYDWLYGWHWSLLI